MSPALRSTNRPPTERHRAAALEIRRFFEPDPERQVEALLIILQRPLSTGSDQEEPTENELGGAA